MNVGEEYSALVALEEAMYIRMKTYGEGDEGAARIVNDIWTLLHKNRLSREKTPDRVNLLREMKSQKGNKGLMSFVFRSKRSLGNIEKEHEGNDLDQANLKGST